MTTALLDRYPTRVPEPAAAFARPDPTVWGDGTGPFTPEALTDFARAGYVVEPELFGADEVERLADAANLLRNRAELSSDPRVVREKADRAVRSIFGVQGLDPMLAALVRDPRLVERARQILGSDVYIHQCRVNYMPAFTGQGFYWHSDFETWHAEDGMPTPRAVSASVALTMNYPFNGSLMVMPGSQTRFVPCVGETPDDHFRSSLKEQTVGVPTRAAIADLADDFGIDQFTGPRGSVLFFDSNVMHGSGSNVTPYARSNIFIVFNSVENALVDPFGASSPRPTFIANRDFTPVAG